MGKLYPYGRKSRLNYENRGRRPRFPTKGGEEKSPYGVKFIIVDSIVLDAKPTITLRLTDAQYVLGMFIISDRENLRESDWHRGECGFIR